VIKHQKYQNVKSFNISLVSILQHHNHQSSAAAQVAAVGAALAAVAAISPPPLNMFPPQGAPQPGAASAGAGVTPAVALAVRTIHSKCNLNIIVWQILSTCT